MALARGRRRSSLRDQTRLRKALAGERSGWAQRLHALLTQEGWPCPRGRLLTVEGRRWVDALELDPGVRTQIEVMLTVMAALQEQLERLESELRRFARADRRCQALETIFGVGPHARLPAGSPGASQPPAPTDPVMWRST